MTALHWDGAGGPLVPTGSLVQGADDKEVAPVPIDPSLSEFEALASPRLKRKPCAVAIAAAALKSDDQEALDKAIGQYSPGVISQWLERRGHDASVTAVSTHQRGKCKCADE